MASYKDRRYRVNESELFNLQSMYEHLRYLLEEGDESDSLLLRLSEVESLMEKAYCVGALVTWPELKRIREIKDERQLIRYNTALASGESEKRAAWAFDC